MEIVNVTLRLDKEKIALLDHLAQADDRDRIYFIEKSIDQYLHINRWQIEETKQALAEADAGDFGSEEEVERMFAVLTR
jgi:predicted transcriptional regulator